MLLISQLKVNIDDHRPLSYIIANKLRVLETEILSYEIQKRSLDARKKNEIYYVYNFIVTLNNEDQILSKNIKGVTQYTYVEDQMGFLRKQYNSTKKIAIVGFGPAGMFAALTFARAGINVTVYERGEEVDKRQKSIETFIVDRKLNPNSNIQFGEGGAGTFSDGKLTNRKKDPIGKWLFKELVDAGAPQEILYVNNPHIGTDRLIHVVKNIRNTILEAGSTIHFESNVTNIENNNDGIVLTVNNEKIQYDEVVLAIGHSARDTVEMLYSNNCNIIQKPFAVGFRIEHRQLDINKAQYGVNYNHPNLGAAEYKLTHQLKDGRGVYTFCMCPGGLVVPAASEEGMLVVNGMSEYARDKINANSALLVTVGQDDFGSDHPLAGLYYQRRIEQTAFELGGGNYNAPIQRAVDFVQNKKTTSLKRVLPSYSIGVTFANLRNVFSEKINQAFLEAIPKLGNKLKGFDSEDALLTGIESRSSSPVRILRDKMTMESINTPHLYPVGEGAGYAGGIVSAAIDGIKVAEIILQKL